MGDEATFECSRVVPTSTAAQTKLQHDLGEKLSPMPCSRNHASSPARDPKHFVCPRECSEPLLRGTRPKPNKFGVIREVSDPLPIHMASQRPQVHRRKDPETVEERTSKSPLWTNGSRFGGPGKSELFKEHSAPVVTGHSGSTLGDGHQRVPVRVPGRPLMWVGGTSGSPRGTRSPRVFLGRPTGK